MSKTETAKRLAQSASEPLKQIVQSQSEQQRRAAKIVESMDQESQSHSQHLTETVTRMVDDLGMFIDSAKVATNDMENQTRQSVKVQQSAATELTKASKAANLSAENLNIQLTKLRWITLLIACVSSVMFGVMLLATLLIMQPRWIEILYRFSQALI